MWKARMKRLYYNAATLEIQKKDWGSVAHRMSTPPRPTYRDTFCETQASAAPCDPAMLASSPLVTPTMTCMPLPASARSTPGSASKSLTLLIRFARIRSTTTPGGARWDDGSRHGAAPAAVSPALLSMAILDCLNRHC